MNQLPLQCRIMRQTLSNLTTLPHRIKTAVPNWFRRRSFAGLNSSIRLGTWVERRLNRALVLCLDPLLTWKNSILGSKKLRRQLKRKRDIKIELCLKLSLLWLFHVGHVVQNRRSALSRKTERFTAACLCCRQSLKYENFTPLFARLHQNIAPKSVPHVQHDYFSSLNQANHWFVGCRCLKLPIVKIKCKIYLLKINNDVN